MATMMTNARLAEMAGEIGGRDAAFVGNVILNWHGGCRLKLRGLLALVQAGHRVRTGQYCLDVLVIDGVQKPWTALMHVCRGE